jgi:hypothetical protein
VAPWFGTDAADLLAMDNAMSPDVTASIANDAAKLLSSAQSNCACFKTVRSARAAAPDTARYARQRERKTRQLEVLVLKW